MTTPENDAALARQVPNLSQAFRETSLIYIDDPQGREALRAAGEVIHLLACEATSGRWEPSVLHVGVAAALKDLEFTADYLGDLSEAADVATLPQKEASLAIVAGALSAAVRAIAVGVKAYLGPKATGEEEPGT